MDTGTPITAQPITPLPPGRKRKSPRARRVRFDTDGDGCLLAIVRNATFISQDQLVTLGVRFKVKAHPDSVRKRIIRYLEYGLVRVIPPVPPYRGAVYQITRAGLEVLESFGIGLGSMSSETAKLPSTLQARHFLDLNEVRLSFSGDKVLSRAKWHSDLEIKASNTNPHFTPFAKDYVHFDRSLSDLWLPLSVHLSRRHYRRLVSLGCLEGVPCRIRRRHRQPAPGAVHRVALHRFHSRSRSLGSDLLL